MKQRKTGWNERTLILLIWMTTLSLLYLVYLKIKILHHSN